MRIANRERAAGRARRRVVRRRNVNRLHVALDRVKHAAAIGNVAVGDDVRHADRRRARVDRAAEFARRRVVRKRRARKQSRRVRVDRKRAAERPRRIAVERRSEFLARLGVLNRLDGQRAARNEDRAARFLGSVLGERTARERHVRFRGRVNRAAVVAGFVVREIRVRELRLAAVGVERAARLRRGVADERDAVAANRAVELIDRAARRRFVRFERRVFENDMRGVRVDRPARLRRRIVDESAVSNGHVRSLAGEDRAAVFFGRTVRKRQTVEDDVDRVLIFVADREETREVLRRDRYVADKAQRLIDDEFAVGQGNRIEIVGEGDGIVRFFREGGELLRVEDRFAQRDNEVARIDDVFGGGHEETRRFETFVGGFERAEVDDVPLDTIVADEIVIPVDVGIVAETDRFAVLGEGVGRGAEPGFKERIAVGVTARVLGTFVPAGEGRKDVVTDDRADDGRGGGIAGDVHVATGGRGLVAVLRDDRILQDDVARLIDADAAIRVVGDG